MGTDAVFVRRDRGSASRQVLEGMGIALSAHGGGLWRPIDGPATVSQAWERWASLAGRPSVPFAASTTEDAQ